MAKVAPAARKNLLDLRREYLTACIDPPVNGALSNEILKHRRI
jgi:hypothetical protein